MTESILSDLRQILKQKGLNAFFVSLSDPHLSEYIPKHYKFISVLSGFTGSNATVIVTLQEAYLWTDSRYWEQATQELFEGFTLMRQGDENVPEPHIWLKEKNNQTELHLAAPLSWISAPKYLQILEAVTSVSTFSDEAFSNLWPNRPQLVFNPPFIHHASQHSAREKLSRLQSLLSEDSSKGALLLTRLDDIAWLTNLRGSDIEFNPVFLSWALIKTDCARLFLNLQQVSPEVSAHLKQAGWCLEDYEKINEVLAAEEIILARTSDLNAAIFHTYQTKIKEYAHPIALWKAIKTEKEIQALKAKMREDGQALELFIEEVKKRLATGEVLYETDVVEILHRYRSQIPGFIEESFATIAAVNANAALPHYAPNSRNNSPIIPPCVLLVDSGAHYDVGTTDTTRTWFLGDTQAFDPEKLKQLKADYQAVYQGMTDLMNAEFEEGTTGWDLDPIARKALKAIGANYGHGTGHGIGLTLNVHETPPNISPREHEGSKTALMPGMIVSDEPGIYRPGLWGIRIENMLVCVKKTNGKLGFECLTQCPIDTTLLK